MCEVESSIPELGLSHSREPADQNGFSTRRGAQSSLCKKVKEDTLSTFIPLFSPARNSFAPFYGLGREADIQRLGLAC